jgi:hypothetical protein
VAFEVCLCGAAVDIEEGLKSESMSGGTPESEEHRDAGGALEFEAAVLIGADEDFVVDEFDGGTERFAAKREFLLLFVAEANPAFELANGLFKFCAEVDGEIDGAGSRILSGAESVDEVDHESGIEGAVVSAAPVFVKREFAGKDTVEQCGGIRGGTAKHLCGASACTGRTRLTGALQGLQECLEDEQEFAGLFDPAFGLQADILF